MTKEFKDRTIRLRQSPNHREMPERWSPSSSLNKPFDELRTNGKLLIPFMVSLSNHERNQLNQNFLNRSRPKSGIT